MDLSNLKIFILDSLKDCFDACEENIANSLYPKIIALKKMGYSKDYPEWVMPFSTSDFVSYHSVVCEEIRSIHGPNQYIPLLAYKTLTYKKCLDYKFTLPILEVAQTSDATDHVRSLRNIIDHFKGREHLLSYDSSWTIHPDIRENADQRNQFKDLMTAIHVLLHREKNIPYILAAGVNRFRLERTYDFWGYEHLSLNGRQLPSFEFVSYGNEVATIFFLKKFSDRANKVADKYQDLWNDRIEIFPPVENKDKIAA